MVDFAAGGIGIGTEGKYLSMRLNHNAVVGAKSTRGTLVLLLRLDPTAGQFMVLPIFLQVNNPGASTWVLEIDIWQNVTFSQKKNVVDA